MTGLLLTGINGTALAENKTVTGEQLNANTIGPGNTAAGDNWNVEVGNGTDPTLYGVSDKNAISVRDDATIHINKNATVTNQAVKNLGNFKTGANTIEVRSGADIVVDGTVRKYGPENMAKPSTCTAAVTKSPSMAQSLPSAAPPSGSRTGKTPVTTTATASSITALSNAPMVATL